MTAHQPPGRSTPASTPTPTRPDATPAQRTRRHPLVGQEAQTNEERENRHRRWATPATVESMCCSPQARSQKGQRGVERAEKERWASRPA